MKISKNFIKSIGFLSGLCILLAITSFLFNRNDDIYDVGSVELKEKNINAEANNSLDVIFLGDSECYSSFSPLQLYSEYGFTSYVCASSAQRLCDSYAILSNIFLTQSPKVIVLEANCLFRNPTSNYDEGDSVIKFLSKRFPIFAYHSDWKKIGGSAVRKRLTKNEANYKGFVIRKSIVPYRGGEYMIKTDAVKKFPDDVYRYLNNINELCEENGAKLIIVSTLSPRNWTYEKHNGVMEWAKTNDVTYLDLNLEQKIKIDWLTDTKDGGDHLNLDGSKKATSFMGEYLSTRYNLSDQRDNPDYKDWADSVEASGAYSMNR